MITDTERLNFLIEKEAHVWESVFGQWHVTVGPSDDSENLEPWNGNYTNARDAIDAAILEVNGEIGAQQGDGTPPIEKPL